MESREEFWSYMMRVRRIGSCLNAVIKMKDEEKIKKWQKIAIKFYYGDKEYIEDVSVCDR